MDAALEQQFNDLQGALDKLRAAVEDRLDKERTDAEARTVRRQGSFTSCKAQARQFRISSITAPRLVGSGPWLVKWIETDGITNRNHELEFDSRIEAQHRINYLLSRRQREQESD